MFVAFLALIVKSYMMGKLRALMQQNSYPFRKIQLELDKITCFSVSSKAKPCLTNPLTKLQRTIYTHLELEPDMCSPCPDNEGQLRAHDSSQDTVPSPEESTYRLAWLSSDYRTVIQVLEVEYVMPTLPEPETAALFIYKMSRNAPNELKYFTFKVFADAGLTRQVGVTQRLHPGAAWCVELEPGVTYYVAEAAEDGWSCTSNVSTRTVDGVKYYYMPVVAVADEHTYVYFYNEPEVKEEPITLEKGIQAEADCTASIQGNPLYLEHSLKPVRKRR